MKEKEKKKKKKRKKKKKTEEEKEEKEKKKEERKKEVQCGKTCLEGAEVFFFFLSHFFQLFHHESPLCFHKEQCEQ